MLFRSQAQDGSTFSSVHGVAGEVRVAEIARMLGGERLSNTSLAHAQEMLSVGSTPAPTPAPTTPPAAAARGRKRS